MNGLPTLAICRPYGWRVIHDAIRFSVAIVVVTTVLDSRVAIAGTAKGKASDVLQILKSSQLTTAHRVSDLPEEILSTARVIPWNRKLDSIMVDPRRDYQDRHAGIDLNKPTAQLIFGAISKRYVLLCYWTGGLTKAEHVTLVERIGSDQAKLIFDGVVYPEARSLSELEQRLRSNNYTSFELSTASTVLP